MMREFCVEDILFMDFRDNDDDEALKQLIINLNSFLYAIIISFIFDDDKTEDVIDSVILELIENKYLYNINNQSIIYEAFLIAKNHIRKQI